MTGAFDRNGQRALMLGTSPRLTPGANPPKFIGIAVQHIRVFVIDHINFIDAKRTDTTPAAAPTSSSCI